jgi:hypothetical protein
MGRVCQAANRPDTDTQHPITSSPTAGFGRCITVSSGASNPISPYSPCASLVCSYTARHAAAALG